MTDLRTRDQLIAILDLIDQLGLDNVAAYHRISAIVGRPIPSTWATITRDEADQVIFTLAADVDPQATLPIDDGPPYRVGDPRAREARSYHHLIRED